MKVIKTFNFKFKNLSHQSRKLHEQNEFLFTFYIHVQNFSNLEILITQLQILIVEIKKIIILNISIAPIEKKNIKCGYSNVLHTFKLTLALRQ